MFPPSALSPFIPAENPSMSRPSRSFTTPGNAAFHAPVLHQLGCTMVETGPHPHTGEACGYIMPETHKQDRVQMFSLRELLILKSTNR